MVPELLFAFGLIVAAADACGAVSGPLISNPTFAFTFAPPLGWTFYTPNATATLVPYPGQQVTAAAAQQRLKGDINAAILMAAQKMGISTIGWTWTTTGYNPTTSILVVDNSAAATVAVAGTYVPGVGAVLQLRAGAAGAITYTDYTESLSIRVTSNNGVYFKSQWQSFSDQVFSILSIYYNVRFRTAVTVT